MAGSSPRDLAVAFRSFPRRLREGLASAADDPARAAAAQPHADALARLVNDAAASLRVPTGADLAATAAAVADRIEAIRPDEWDPASLERLREDALEGGRLLRRVEAAASR